MAGTTKKGSAVHGQYKKEEYGRVHAYVDGTAVRRLDPVPEKVQKRPAPQVSAETKQNRERALQMSVGYVLFLTAAAVVTVLTCVNYLQLKSDLTGKMKTVAALETELSQVKEDNNAYESQVTSDVDLNTIKKLAIGRLGMNYPTDDQKKTYSMPSNSYVRQYQDVN